MQPTLDGITLLKMLGMRDYQVEVLTQQLAQAKADAAELLKVIEQMKQAAPPPQ